MYMHLDFYPMISGESSFVVFRFFNGGNQVGGPLAVYEGSSVGFTAISFTRIEVSVPSGDSGDVASGQFCITPRYQINCEIN